VLALGTLCYAAGLLLMPQATSPTELALSAGVLVGLGLAGTYMIVIGVTGRAFPPEQRSTALGTLSALASFGQFAMLPYGQALISGFGWRTALVILAVNVCLMLPLAIPLARSPAGSGRRGAGGQSLREALAEAKAHRGFWLVTLGFFVCGFQVVFVATHLPAYLVDSGLSTDIGMIALALIGLANIPGSFLAGRLGARCSKRLLLSGIYLARAAIITAFVSFPATEWTVYAFSVALGFVWLSTVPLTGGIVAQIFGPQYMSMLFGVVYLGHQIGAFLGGWLGGYAYDAGGSYLPAWVVAVLLSLIAAVANILADESPLRRAEPAAAAAQ
jgi:predicted MFS family arabinose efflux permease